MNKLIPLLAFSILLIVPVGTQNAFSSLIGDQVTVAIDVPFFPQAFESLQGVVINNLVTPEFIFTNSRTVNVESEEIWIEYQVNPPFTSSSFFPHEVILTDLDWIEDGVVIPGNIQGVICNVQGNAATPPSLGTVTFSNNQITIPVGSLFVADDQIATIHCEIDVVHDSVIGGELIPIDSTVLILAGAQTFSWMIPVLLSGIGIGMFVVGRRT